MGGGTPSRTTDLKWEKALGMSGGDYKGIYMSHQRGEGHHEGYLYLAVGRGTNVLGRDRYWVHIGRGQQYLKRDNIIHQHHPSAQHKRDKIAVGIKAKGTSTPLHHPSTSSIGMTQKGQDSGGDQCKRDTYAIFMTIKYKLNLLFSKHPSAAEKVPGSKSFGGAETRKFPYLAAILRVSAPPKLLLSGTFSAADGWAESSDLAVKTRPLVSQAMLKKMARCVGNFKMLEVICTLYPYLSVSGKPPRFYRGSTRRDYLTMIGGTQEGNKQDIILDMIANTFQFISNYCSGPKHGVLNGVKVHSKVQWPTRVSAILDALFVRKNPNKIFWALYELSLEFYQLLPPLSRRNIVAPLPPSALGITPPAAPDTISLPPPVTPPQCSLVCKLMVIEPARCLVPRLITLNGRLPPPGGKGHQWRQFLFAHPPGKRGEGDSVLVPEKSADSSGKEGIKWAGELHGWIRGVEVDIDGVEKESQVVNTNSREWSRGDDVFLLALYTGVIP
ncbi:hypothetical protein B0H16DRAFT_1459932 [Mycena metata]|uniref:Uncharacterized protein n=1 Tax=Mycena metata TaxID=1033252 RepID=A0AAD7NAA9_9AGAR|nr:hypothetical protein B0H16DRAFT_1459932 [Mycena metata]